MMSDISYRDVSMRGLMRLHCCGKSCLDMLWDQQQNLKDMHTQLSVHVSQQQSTRKQRLTGRIDSAQNSKVWFRWQSALCIPKSFSSEAVLAASHFDRVKKQQPRQVYYHSLECNMMKTHFHYLVSQHIQAGIPEAVNHFEAVIT